MGALAAASQPGLALVASQGSRSPRPGRGRIDTSELRLVPPAFNPPLPTKLLGSGPLPSLAASAEPPWGRQGRRRSGLRTAGARAAKYLLELSETDRHVGNLVCVGLGEAAEWAGRQEVGSWGCLPRLLSPAETTILPVQIRCHIQQLLSSCSSTVMGVDCDPGWGLMTELTLGKGVPC